MKQKKFYYYLAVFFIATLSGMFMFSCFDSGSSGGGGSSEYVGNLYAGRNGVPISRSSIDTSEFAIKIEALWGFPLNGDAILEWDFYDDVWMHWDHDEEKWIEVDEDQGDIVIVRPKPGTNGFIGWPLIDVDLTGDSNVILLNDQRILGDLSIMKPRPDKNAVACDFFTFDIIVMHKGKRVSNFPDGVFVKGEGDTAQFYSRDASLQTYGWSNSTDIEKKYPMIKDFISGDDSSMVLIPFDGIDFSRNFDLKVEWNLEAVVKALEDAYASGGDYEQISDPTKPFIKDFYKGVSLQVLYK